MQVQFNKPVSIAGETYGKGQHTLPDSAKDDWYLAALVSDGDAVILREAEVEVEPETPAEIEAAILAEIEAEDIAEADADPKPEAETGIAVLEAEVVPDSDIEPEAEVIGDGEPEAIVEGDVEPETTGILDGSLKEVTEILPALRLDELEVLLADEKAGKTRKSVIAAIEGEIKTRV